MSFLSLGCLICKRKSLSLVIMWMCRELGTPSPGGQALCPRPCMSQPPPIIGEGSEDQQVTVCYPQKTPSPSLCPSCRSAQDTPVLVAVVIPKAPSVHTWSHPVLLEGKQGAAGGPGTSCGPGANSGFLRRSTTCHLPLS